MSLHDDELRALLDEGRRLEAAGTPLAAGSAGEASGGPTAPAAGTLAWSRAWRAELEEPDVVPSDDDLAGRRGRPTRTLQAMWIDPEETPFTPVPRPGRALPSQVFSLAVTAAVLGLLAWLIVPEVSYRLATIDELTIHDGVLTAHAVPLAPTTPATVEKLYVDPGHVPTGVLPAGTPIARLRTQTADVFGNNTVDISVPFDARFVSIDTLRGAVALPGTPVATVYDPQKMYVIVTVAPKTLDLLRRGMKVELRSRLLPKPISGTLVGAVPLLGTDQDPASTNLVNVRIQPDRKAILDLVPGIRFDAAIDLNSAPKDAPPLVLTNSDGDGASRSAKAGD